MLSRQKLIVLMVVMLNWSQMVAQAREIQTRMIFTILLGTGTSSASFLFLRYVWARSRSGMRYFFDPLNRLRAILVRHREKCTINCMLRLWPEKNFKQYLRMGRPAFYELVDALKDHVKDSLPRCKKKRVYADFKIACALFWLAHGGGFIPTAAACGIGETTLRSYVSETIGGINIVLGQRYFSTPSAADVASNRVLFGSRRGLDCVALAVDGTHIPWVPDDAYTSDRYRNYKGWNSISVLAFCDSRYIFRGLDVGWPGRASDATIFSVSDVTAVMRSNPTAWLGHGGVFSADSGFGQGSDVLLPWPESACAKKSYFNFCHSSTRFFVEEAFGRVKNRFRVLLKANELSNEHCVEAITACFLLHNFCEDNKYVPVARAAPRRLAALSYREFSSC